MDFLYLAENVDVLGVYSTEQSVHSIEGVSLFTCALMCTSYALCSSIFHNTESDECILIYGFHFPGDRLMSGEFWHYFRPVAHYRVTMTTSPASYAGTDATVLLTIIGSKGKTQELQLEDKNGDFFESGSTDTFMFRSVDVGEIDAVEIHHDNTGIEPRWFLVLTSITKTGGLGIEIEVNQWVPTTPLRLSKS